MSRQPRIRQETTTNKYRISELVEASGVSRDMIKYYLRANLLPKPRKPRPNLSLYSDSHLSLIRLILQFQEQTKLSLPAIAQVFREANFEPGPIEIELLSGRHSSGHRDNIVPFEASTNSSISLSFPEDFMQEMIRYGLLNPDDTLDENDEKIAGLVWAAKGEGVPIAFFQAAREKLIELADLEVKALISVPRPGLDFDAVMGNVTDIDRVINRWIITEKTGQARRMLSRILQNSENALSTVHDAIYFPSNVFRQRFNVATELAKLGRATEDSPRKLSIVLAAGRSCLMLTEFDTAITYANTALELAPDDDVAIAIKSLSYSMNGNLEKALLYARRLEASQSRHPLAMEARLLVLLMQAAKLGGVSDTSGLLKDAADLFREPVTVAPRAGADQLEAWLLEARANTLFPDAINKVPEAIKTLESMLEMLENTPYDALGLQMDGERAVYQVYASFYLGQLYERANDPARSRQFLERVIQLDPSSNFGESAYLKLS